MLMEELERKRIASLILRFHPVLRKVGTGTHEPVQLVLEPLDVVRHLEALLILLHALRRLALRRKQHGGDSDARAILGIDPSRRRLHRGPEQPRLVARDHARHLAAPAVAHDAPGLDARVHLLRRPQNARQLRLVEGPLRVLEPLGDDGLLLVGGGRVPLHARRLPVEEVRHEDLVRLLRVSRCQDVGALEDLREEAEDVIRGQDGLVGVSRTRHVFVAL